jgi:hypothetical protein
VRGKIRILILFSALLLVLSSASEGNAGCSDDAGSISSRLTLNYGGMKSRAGGDIDALSLFNSEDSPLDFKALKRAETLSLYGERLENRSVSVGEMMMKDSFSEGTLSAGSKKRIAVSMVASALLPGLGELYLYFNSGSKDMSILARAIGFIALEGYLWYGYDSNHDRGKDFKRQYEEYGDAHWSEEDFLIDHPYCEGVGGCTSWEEYNENAKDNDWYFYYTAREVDREEYYENMGKYDAFLYGWDDWNGKYAHYDENPNYWTPHRTHFVSLRDESNKYLLRADHHLMGLIASRIVSMVHAGWLANREGDRGGSSGGWSFELKNSAVRSRFSLNYRF